MPFQDTLYKWTEGKGSRWLNLMLVFLGVVGLAVWYDLAAYKNLSVIEGFDASQVARNLAQGRGYSTDFVRPFSMYLLRKHRADHDPLIQEAHPDLANAPFYPVLLAGALKLMPFPFPNLTGEKEAGIYLPERWIAGFNQLLFLIAVLLLQRLATRLFDERVGWIAAASFAGTELFWRFSVSGLPTMLAIVLVISLAGVLTRLSPPNPDGPEQAGQAVGGGVGWAMAAGVLTGMLGMTRYSLGWLAVPVVVYLCIIPSARRPLLIAVYGMTLAAIMAPWITRNYLVSGTPFGTAGFAVYEATRVFPGFELMRTLNADFSLVTPAEFSTKLLNGLKEIFENPLSRLGGNWLAAFFLAGLFVPFRRATLGRLRIFVVAALGTLMVAEAMGRTEVSQDSAITAENLLIVLAPLVLMFGAGLFQNLSERFMGGGPGAWVATVSVFLLVTSTPMLLSLVRPVVSPVAYPPYHPKLIQEKAWQIGEKDWLMTDIPWAVAWYGARQSVWLSLRYKETQDLQRPNDFAAMNGLGKRLQALYLSSRMSKSVDTWGLWSWIHREKRENWEAAIQEWEAFLVAGAYAELQVPTGFPLKDAPFGLWPELFLMDSEREAPNPIKGE